MEDCGVGESCGAGKQAGENQAERSGRAGMARAEAG
jgi:hypothetical protein